MHQCPVQGCWTLLCEVENTEVRKHISSHYDGGDDDDEGGVTVTGVTCPWCFGPVDFSGRDEDHWKRCPARPTEGASSSSGSGGRGGGGGHVPIDLSEDHPPTPARFLDFDRGGLDCDRGGPGPSFEAPAVSCYESLKALEDHVEGELEKSVKAETELNERMGNYELASENMKKILLDKGHADYAKMSAALSEIKLALEQNDFRSAVSALMLANDKAAGDVLSAKKRRFNKATPSGS